MGQQVWCLVAQRVCVFLGLCMCSRLWLRCVVTALRSVTYTGWTERHVSFTLNQRLFQLNYVYWTLRKLSNIGVFRQKDGRSFHLSPFTFSFSLLLRERQRVLNDWFVTLPPSLEYMSLSNFELRSREHVKFVVHSPRHHCVKGQQLDCNIDGIRR